MTSILRQQRLSAFAGGVGAAAALYVYTKVSDRFSETCAGNRAVQHAGSGCTARGGGGGGGRRGVIYIVQTEEPCPWRYRGSIPDERLLCISSQTHLLHATEEALEQLPGGVPRVVAVEEQVGGGCSHDGG